MKKLTTGLVLVMLILLLGSCTEGPDLANLIRRNPIEEKPALTEQQQEMWFEMGVISVSTIEEASRLVGYPVAKPTYLPLGYLTGDFELSQIGRTPQLGGEWGDCKRVVTRHWVWAANFKSRFSLMQFQGPEESIDGEPIEICGHPGKREFHEAEDSREYPLVVLCWFNNRMGYLVSGSLVGELTEEILLKIACSVNE